MPHPSRLPLAAALLLTAGCAVPVDLTAVEAPPAPLGGGAVRVTVEDRRAAVARGERSPAWVGTSRTTMGIGRDAVTASGQPVAQELEQALVAGWAGGAEGPARDAGRARLAVVQLDADGYFGELTVAYELELTCTRGDEPVAHGRAAGEATVGYVGAAGFAAACRAAVAQALAEVTAAAQAEEPPGPSGSGQADEAATCAGCGAELDPSWKLCPHCGRER